jgi:hypothetical protein
MSATKVDLKRGLRAFYSAGPEPVMVDVPELAFLMIDGHGDPNSAAEYSAAVQALYPLAMPRSSRSSRYQAAWTSG